MVYTNVIEAVGKRKDETMSKPRINANVAKLEIGKVYRWSETSIGAVALDNAIAGGHLIFVETEDKEVYSVMRPTQADLQNMIPTVNQFGTTVYCFPTAKAQNAAAETATVSQKEDATMTTTTQTTPAARADAALDTFIKTAGTEYNSTRDQLVDLIASAHHLARQLGLDWKDITNDASTLYKATKPVAEAKPTKATTKPAKASSTKRDEQYTIVTPTPNGEITNTRGKPYTHAAIVHTAAGWEVYALVSSKETAKKRLGDARHAGLAFDQHDVVETRIVDWAADPAQVEHDIMIERAQKLDVVELTATEAIDAGVLDAPTAEQRRAAIAAALDAGVLPVLTASPEVAAQIAADDAEIVREAEVDEPMHVQIASKATRGTMVHYSDDGLDTYCGCGSERDYRQVEDAVTCSKCLRIAASRATKA